MVIGKKVTRITITGGVLSGMEGQGLKEHVSPSQPDQMPAAGLLRPAEDANKEADCY